MIGQTISHYRLRRLFAFLKVGECFYEKVIKVKADVAAFPYLFSFRLPRLH
jgi:hypothetical protein